MSEVVFFHELVRVFGDTTSLRKLENRIEIVSDLSEVVFFHELVRVFADTASLREHENHIKVKCAKTMSQ